MLNSELVTIGCRIVSKTNGSTKLGIANTGAVVKATFKDANACLVVSLHLIFLQ